MMQHLHYSTIVVDDIEKSLYCYRDIIGFTTTIDHVMEG